MACEGCDVVPQRPQVFSSLVLAGTGLLAFQGLACGDCSPEWWPRLAAADRAITAHVVRLARLSQIRLPMHP